MFSSEDVRLPGWTTIDAAIRSTLNSASSNDVAFYNEGLDNARIPNEKYEVEYVNFLRRKYDGEKIDLIFVRGAGAIRFLLKHEARIFGGVPKVVSVTDRRQISGLDMGDDATGVYGKLEFARTVELILKQQPAAKRIVVVTGSSVQDKSYLEQAKKEFAAFGDKVEIAYLSDLAIPDLQNQLSSLPSDNVCLFISYFRDPDARLYTLPAAISLVMPSVEVPMYAVAETAMGTGVVGGDMLNFQLTGERIAEVGRRILSGEKPSDIPETLTESVPMFDWRQLRRWNISEESIPPGSIVRFKEPTVWEQYRGYIIAVLAVLLIQTGLIVSLILSQARRRKAEVDRNKFRSLAEAGHERLAEVVSNVPGIVWESRVVDETGRRRAQFVSGYVEEMLGYTVEECLADPGFIASRVVDEDREMYQSQAESVFQSGDERVVQFRCMTKDGGWKWAESHIVVIRDDAGNHVGLRGVTMDVTGRKEAEEALTASEERYRNVVETQSELICRYLPDTTLTFVNDAYCRYFGKTREELIGRKFVDLIPLHARDAVLSHIASLGENPLAESYDHEVLRPDGTRGWHQWIDHPVETLNGNPRELQGVGRDITEMREAEEALRASETRFRVMADSAPVLIWICGPDKLCSYVNQGWLDFTGRSIDMELGSGWTGGIHSDDSARVAEIFDSAFDRRQPFKLEYRLRGADGDFRWLYDSGTPRFSAEGEFLGYIGSCVDISDRKEAEDGLKKALNEVSQLQEQLREENIYLKEEIKLEHNFGEIIGHSDALKYVLFKIEQVAPTDATVLITGETGTGKELVARAIHSGSRRNDRPLVKLNCAALSPNLIESELFGHERGSFTGASARKIGRFELANNATIFLDEIGELAPEMQSKLLRVIQEGEFERLGSSKTIKADVRIMAATNRNLEAEVRAGRFREDLLFRLNVFPVTVPPLRERMDDIPALVEHFASLFSRKLGKTISSVSPATIRSFTQYQWPGNIRELANVIERAVISSTSENLHIASPLADEPIKDSSFLMESLESIERNHIIRILLNTNWRVEGRNGAARILGLNPSTLRTRMSKLGIVKDNSAAI